MRSLPSVSSADYVSGAVTARITPLDGGATWVYSQAHIQALHGLGWEVDFGGGTARTTRYELTLSDSLTQIMQRKARLARAEVRLEVLANSDTFYPHVGRVRGFDHHADNPHLITLDVADRLLEDDPQLPAERLVDSWSNVHPEDLALGYPLYYGFHHRPFYFAAVDCAVGTLLGPRNISSENHVNSVFWSGNLRRDPEPAELTNFFLGHVWEQQSGAANIASYDGGFICVGAGSADQLREFWRFDGQVLSQYGRNNELSYLDVQEITVHSPSLAAQAIGSYRRVRRKTAYMTIWDGFTTGNSADTRYALGAGVQMLPGMDLEAIVWADVTASFSGVANPSSWSGEVVAAGVNPDQFPKGTLLSWSNSNAGASSGSGVASLTNAEFRGLHALLTAQGSFAGVAVEVDFTVGLHGRIKGSAYRRYSVFAPVQNSADLAISANPMGILDDVWSAHLAIPFRQDQSSDVAVAVQSHVVHAFFAERESVFGRNGIADRLGREAGFYSWIGDSGMLNFRAYTESAGASLDAVITTSEWLTVQLRENPLGITTYNARQASRFKVDYAFDYQLGRYQASAAAGPASNALCGSADAAGVRDEVRLESKFILSADVASLALGHQLRIHGQGQRYLEGDLPAQFWGLELGDVIEGHQPIIPGSLSLFQIVSIRPDYLGGTVRIKAAELRQADGS